MTHFDTELNQIAYIKNLIEQTSNLPISILNCKQENLFSDFIIDDYVLNQLDLTKTYTTPQIKLYSLDEIYMFISYIKESELIGTFIVGPISYKKISLNQLIHQAMLIHNLIYHEPLTFEEVLKENFYDEQLIEQMENKLQSDFTHIRIDDQIHEPFVPLHYERELLSYVKHGNTSELIKIIDKLTPTEAAINHLNEDPIQTMQTMVITLLILASRAAMTGGLPTALAYKINTYYLEKIQKTTDIHQLNQLKMTCLIDLTSRINQINTTETSRPVSDTIFYITKNLYNNISLNDICEALHFSPSYLSRLFKKEMNLTISEFITQEKIEEAKRLLIGSNHTLLEISNLLHFSDQSYFTKSFKKVTGMTPKVYRNRYKLLS